MCQQVCKTDCANTHNMNKDLWAATSVEFDRLVFLISEIGSVITYTPVYEGYRDPGAYSPQNLYLSFIIINIL